jgi:hypothetical protein
MPPGEVCTHSPVLPDPNGGVGPVLPANGTIDPPLMPALMAFRT